MPRTHGPCSTRLSWLHGPNGDTLDFCSFLHAQLTPYSDRLGTESETQLYHVRRSPLSPSDSPASAPTHSTLLQALRNRSVLPANSTDDASASVIAAYEQALRLTPLRALSDCDGATCVWRRASISSGSSSSAAAMTIDSGAQCKQQSAELPSSSSQVCRRERAVREVVSCCLSVAQRLLNATDQSNAKASLSNPSGCSKAHATHKRKLKRKQLKDRAQALEAKTPAPPPSACLVYASSGSGFLFTELVTLLRLMRALAFLPSASATSTATACSPPAPAPAPALAPAPAPARGVELHCHLIDPIYKEPLRRYSFLPSATAAPAAASVSVIASAPAPVPTLALRLCTRVGRCAGKCESQSVASTAAHVRCQCTDQSGLWLAKRNDYFWCCGGRAIVPAASVSASVPASASASASAPVTAAATAPATAPASASASAPASAASAPAPASAPSAAPASAFRLTAPTHFESLPDADREMFNSVCALLFCSCGCCSIAQCAVPCDTGFNAGSE